MTGRFRELVCLATLLPTLLMAMGRPADAQQNTAAGFQVDPPDVRVAGNFERVQLLVRARLGGAPADEHSPDLTGQASYSSTDPSVVSVSPGGQIVTVGNGTATVEVRVADEVQLVPVSVSGVVPATARPGPSIHYLTQVVPVLSKSGCSNASCHASQYGKGGFKLTVFAFDPDADHAAITRGSRGRRVNFAAAEQSLLLLKPTAAVPHGGGRRLEPGSVDYRILAAWLAGGAPPQTAKEPKVTGLRVEPVRRLGTGNFQQQLRVVASYNDGGTRDVTAWAQYDSADEGVLRVSPQGLVEVVGRGQGSALVRFAGQTALMQVVAPYAPPQEPPGWIAHNFIDTLAADKFRELGLTPAPLCDDATFLRRAFLDVLGKLPTVAETRAFLDSANPAKRRELIDRLLGLTGDPAQDVYNDDYAAYWSIKWADLLRSSSAALGEQGMWALHNWLQDSLCRTSGWTCSCVN